MAEMVRKGITRKDISEKVKCSYNSVIVKLNGKSDFTLDEATIIKEKFFPDLSIDYLFKRFDVEEKEFKGV
jgi:hypothetical protein